MVIDPEMHDKWALCIDTLMQINQLKESSWIHTIYHP